jgi:hypothetical protein
MTNNRAHPETIATCLLLAWVAVPASSVAATGQLEVSTAVGRTDNLMRTSVGEESATLASAGLDFSLLHESRRLEADLAGALQFLEYGGSEYSSEVVGRAGVHAGLAIVPGSVKWVVDDSFGQLRRDLFAVPTPDNRESVNVFSTGPEAQLRLAGAVRLVLGATYGRVDYESGEAELSRRGARIALQRDLSGGGVLGLNLAEERIEPRDEVVPDYDRTSAFVTYRLRGARSSLAVDVGGNRIDGDDVDETGALIRLELTRRVGRFSRVRIAGGQQFSDAASNLLVAEAPDVQASGIELVAQTAQPFTRRYAELGLDATGRRTFINLFGQYIDEDYERDPDANRQRLVAGLGAGRLLGARTEARISVAYSGNEFDVDDSDNHDLTYAAALAWRLGRRLRVEVSGEHYDYESGIPGTDAGETRYWLRLRYGEPPSRSPRL